MNKRQRKKREAQHRRTRMIFYSLVVAMRLGFKPKPQRIKALRDRSLQEFFEGSDWPVLPHESWE
jgi:hypothetical protein